MYRLGTVFFLLLGCTPVGHVAAVPAPVPLAHGQHEQSRESDDAAGAAHWERVRAWERQQQAATVEAKERADWDAGKPITVRDTPEGLVGMLVRLDDTADRVDDAMAYFEFQTALVVCTREPWQPHRFRWGRGKGSGKRWRASPGYRRKGYWRGGGRSGKASEPVEEYRGVFWDYQFGQQPPSTETPTVPPANKTTCKTVTRSWSMGIAHPPNYRFQVGDRIQAVGRPQRTDTGLLLTDASFKFVGRGQTVLFAALPSHTPL